MFLHALRKHCIIFWFSTDSLLSFVGENQEELNDYYEKTKNSSLIYRTFIGEPIRYDSKMSSDELAAKVSITCRGAWRKVLSDF